MSRNKFYIGVIAVLLISNVALLAFHLSKRPKMRMQPRQEIIRTLQFDKNQTTAFEALIPKHQEQIKAKSQALFKAKKALYRQIALPSEEQKADSLIAIINSLQKEIETAHYQHFNDIKAICRPEQMENFAKLSDMLAGLFDHKKGPPPTK